MGNKIRRFLDRHGSLGRKEDKSVEEVRRQKEREHQKDQAEPGFMWPEVKVGDWQECCLTETVQPDLRSRIADVLLDLVKDYGEDCIAFEQLQNQGEYVVPALKRIMELVEGERKAVEEDWERAQRAKFEAWLHDSDTLRRTLTEIAERFYSDQNRKHGGYFLSL